MIKRLCKRFCKCDVVDTVSIEKNIKENILRDMTEFVTDHKGGISKAKYIEMLDEVVRRV